MTLDPNATMPLGEFSERKAHVPTSALHVREVLGRGGMGVVFAAHQAALSRDVALKRPADDAPARASNEIVREAMVTGQLEHPNIVPVHDLCLNELGQPMLVMKKIRGVEWGTLIDADHAAGAMSDDRVAYHLEVLGSVCNAVRFAHSEGIIHRDLKPQNVMVGPFGEVYLLDWGIATRVGPDGGMGIDRGEVTGVAGTPLYMAPEQFFPEPGNQSEATDVYLLGGLLVYVLTGRPPRAPGTLQQMAHAAARGVELDDSLPSDLRRLLEKVFAPNPASRPTVEAFEAALQEHRRYQLAVALVQQAHRRLDELEESEATVSQRYDAYGAARFALQEALRYAPDLPRVREQLDGLTERLVEEELRSGRPAAAASYLNEIASPDPALSARVQQELDAARLRDAELARLRAEVSTGRGAVLRTVYVVALGVIWLGLPGGLALAGFERSYEQELLRNGVNFCAMLLGLVVLRSSFQSTQLNRQILYLVLTSPLCRMFVTLGLWSTEATVAQLTVATTTVDASLMLAGSITLDARIAPIAVFYGLAAVLVGVFPESTALILIPASVVVVVYMATVWGLFDAVVRRYRSA